MSIEMSNILFNILFLVLILGLSEPTEQNICGGVYSNEHGTILTPNYPNSYPQHLVCKWNISVAQNNSILLTFVDFYTDKKDYLNVFDVIDGIISLRGQYSGHNHPKYLISTQNNLFMNLSTTSARKGFKLFYEQINKCGGLHEDFNKIISSPGYPKRYFENSNCHWTIICPENRTINVKFLDIDLEEGHAFITISDSSSNLLANVTGRARSHNLLLTKSNKLFVNFKSDNGSNSQGFRGFSISYTSQVVGSELPLIISTSNAMITTNQNQTIDNIIYNSVTEYQIIEYDIIRRKLILFDPQTKRLFADHLLGKGIAINSRSDGIAFDWIHQLIYWIDIEIKTINVMNTTENEPEFYSICQLSDENQRDLVINVQKSQIIWSQIGFLPKLWKVNLDGSDPQQLYSNSRQAFHLTIDYQRKRYYFIDISDYSLFSIDFNGNNEIFFMRSSSFFNSIISMTILNNHLYLANNQMIYRISDLDLRIKRAEILFKSGINELLTERQNFYDFKSLDIKRPKIFCFKIIDSILQPNATNQCLNTKCDGFCLPTPSSYRCLMTKDVPTSSSPIIINSSSNGNTLAIFNSVIIVILVIILVLLYFSVKQMIIKFENRIFQVLVPTVSFRKSQESNHEYENHDYEEPVFKK